MIRFTKLSDREKAWKSKRKLRDSGITIKEDLPPNMENAMKTLLPIHKEAIRQKRKSNLIRDHIYIYDRRYTLGAIHLLPPELQLSNLSKKETENCIYYFGRHHPFSNFYSCKFINEGIEYNCSEQFFCAAKAAHFEDPIAKLKILNCNDPIVMKKTTIKVFTQEDWNLVSQKIMEKAVTLKFQQNPKLQEILKATSGKMIAEASPSDNHWGIGLGLNDPNLLDQSKWGKNKMGNILMIVRGSL